MMQAALKCTSVSYSTEIGRKFSLGVTPLRFASGSQAFNTKFPAMFRCKTPVAKYGENKSEAANESLVISSPLLQHRDQSVDIRSSIAPFFFPALGGLLFGYDIGATSGALVSLKDSVLSGTSWFNFSALESGLIVSGSLGGALAGSVLAFYIADILGRRRELITAAGLYFLGAFAMAAAPSLHVLILGRLLFGIGIGLAMHAAPMYIAETSPSGIRGTLISLKEAFIVLGILMGFSVSSALITSTAGWRLMYGLAAPVAILMALGMFVLPPSPRWLVSRAAKASDAAEKESFLSQAVHSLLRLRGAAMEEKQAEGEVLEMVGPRSAEEGGVAAEEEEVSMAELFQGGNLKALTVAGGLVFFQQVTGQPSVLYYAASILQDAGFANAGDATKVSILLGLFKLLLTGVAVFTVDKVGRRPLLLAGVAGLVASLLALGTYYSFPGANPIFSVAALLLYVGAYQVSFGPISWLMVSEVFALRVRGKAQSLATLVNFGSNALVTFCLPPLQVFLGQAGTFYVFALIGVASLVFIFLKVPETKGLSLEEIELELIK